MLGVSAESSTLRSILRMEGYVQKCSFSFVETLNFCRSHVSDRASVHNVKTYKT